VTRSAKERRNLDLPVMNHDKQPLSGVCEIFLAGPTECGGYAPQHTAALIV
jgi:hypothetical protein